MNDKLFKKINENDLSMEEYLKMRVTEEYEKALMNKIDELQNNWNSLKQMLKEENYFEIVDKMNELEGNDKE